MADLSLDGEADGQEQREIDAHLARCPACQQKFHGHVWFQSNVRDKLRESSDDMSAPMALRAQIATQLRVEDRRAPQRLRFTSLVPATLALSTIAVVGWSFSQSPTLELEEPVLHHTRNLPPEVRARSSEPVQELFEKNLRYRVRVPRFRRPAHNVQLVGGRLSHIKNREAAYVMYDDRGARISMFAYPIEGRYSVPSSFRERQINGRTVLVGKHRGYNVVTWESGDVLYSLVSEVDPNELVELAATIE